MRTFRGELTINSSNEPVDFEFVMDDDATDEEIETAAKDAAIEEIGLDWEWEEVE